MYYVLSKAVRTAALWRVYLGKFIIAHSREYSFTNCHFSAASIDEVGQLLSNLQVHDFTYEIGKIMLYVSRRANSLEHGPFGDRLLGLGGIFGVFSACRL